MKKDDAPAFQEQIDRLKTQFGAKNFSKEKSKLIFAKFSHRGIGFFEKMISHILLNSRYSPTIKEFIDAEYAIDMEKKNIEKTLAHGKNGILDLPPGRAKPDFVKLCQKTYSDYVSGKLTKKQFHEACNSLDDMANRINPPNDRVKPSTQGLRIKSIVLCDKCGYHYWFTGIAIELAISRRLCFRCRP